MKLHELGQNKSRKTRKRVGRGSASGTGTTAGRGMNGQNSRSGGGVRPGFEGGQMPLFRRLPRIGFNNKRFARVYTELPVSKLNQFDEGTVVTQELLLEEGVIKKINDGVKILGNGKLEKKLTVKVKKFTKSAASKIEAEGGKAEVI